jgi:hypothetical protein
MNTIYLAWEDRRSRRWFPVGRLVRNDSGTCKYEFSYTEGARQAKESAGFVEIPGFRNLDEQYQADELFPAFANRTMNLGRPDRAGYLSGLGLDEAEWDALSELCVSGGLSHADSFEVFPEIEPDREGRFETRFVLHGLRHLNKHAIERSESLRVGDALRLSFELNNPVTLHAILVMTDDYYSLGWLPRYLVDCMHRGGGWLVEDVEVSVAKVNPYAPLSNRLLVDFSGRLPEGFNPMKDLEEFKPIGGTGSGRESESGDEETLVADLHAIGLRSASLMGPGPSAVEHGDFLYDDQGLPR